MYRKFPLKVILLSLCFITFFHISPLGLCAQDFNDEYRIGIDDILDIQVWDNKDLNCVVEVTKEGSFTFPLIGKVYTAGLSTFELENHIKTRLADGYLINPELSVTIKTYNNQKVFLLGEVKNPGNYILKNKTHILELISMAGGFTDAAGRIIKILRPMKLEQNKSVRKTIDPGKNSIIMIDLGKYSDDIAFNMFYVASGDIIYVNEVPRIFVNGEVRKPGEFEWEADLTVRQAVSLAGGYTDKAALKRTTTIRLINGKEKEINTNMGDTVMPDDIIKVPGRYF